MSNKRPENYFHNISSTGGTEEDVTETTSDKCHVIMNTTDHVTPYLVPAGDRVAPAGDRVSRPVMVSSSVPHYSTPPPLNLLARRSLSVQLPERLPPLGSTGDESRDVTT